MMRRAPRAASSDSGPSAPPAATLRQAARRSSSLSPPTAVRCVSRRRSPFLVWSGLREPTPWLLREPGDLQQLGDATRESRRLRVIEASYSRQRIDTPLGGYVERQPSLRKEAACSSSRDVSTEAGQGECPGFQGGYRPCTVRRTNPWPRNIGSRGACVLFLSCDVGPLPSVTMGTRP